jgi:hypothetical protein
MWIQEFGCTFSGIFAERLFDGELCRATIYLKTSDIFSQLLTKISRNTEFQ